MREFGRRLDGPGGRRSAPRCPVVRAAAIMTLERSRIVSLIDVSATGAKIQGCGDVPVGSSVWLRVGTLDAFACVVWTAADLCGIAFDEPLGEEQILQLGSEANWAQVAELSPDERIAAEYWLNDFVR